MTVTSPIQSRDHFPLWLNEHGLTGMGVEVGTYYGQYASEILKVWKGKLICIDPYKNFPDEEWRDGCNIVNLDEAKGCAVKFLEQYHDRARLLLYESLFAVAVFVDDTLDFVYIDANHDFKHVSEDLRAWFPKVKPGGVLAGHDYYTKVDDKQRCEVPKALEGFLNEHPELCMTLTSDTSWWIVKPCNKPSGGL